jgi:hypothetical protein
MAYVSDFTFNGMSRIGNDSCSQDINSIQNSQACTYTLQNYFSQCSSMGKAMEFAVTQPGINYTGSFGMSAGGCNVDDSSKLFIGGIQSHPKARIDLFGRPYATVPYLGRGSVDPILESQIQQGESISGKLSITKLGEKSYLPYHTTPLISEVKQHIQNPGLMIESMASKGWIRGGVPSRELTRDQDFYTGN